MSERIEQAVIAEQQAKIEVGKALEQAVENEALAEAAYKEAQAATSKARRAALSAGWDEKTLRRLGLLKPAPRSTRKGAGRRAASEEPRPEVERSEDNHHGESH